jgi:L-asparagine transporter-like permease
MLLYSAFVIYLGAYEAAARKKMMRSWHDRCQELHIPTSIICVLYYINIFKVKAFLQIYSHLPSKRENGINLASQ